MDLKIDAISEISYDEQQEIGHHFRLHESMESSAAISMVSSKANLHNPYMDVKVSTIDKKAFSRLQNQHSLSSIKPTRRQYDSTSSQSSLPPISRRKKSYSKIKVVAITDKEGSWIKRTRLSDQKRLE